MAKVLMTAGLAAILATGLLVIYAQTSAISESHKEVARLTGAVVIEPGRMRASKLLRNTVYNTRDAKIGEIKELVLDRDGKVAAVVVDVAFVGFGDKYVAVNLSDISDSNNHLTLNRTSDQLQQMTSYKIE